MARRLLIAVVLLATAAPGASAQKPPAAAGFEQQFIYHTVEISATVAPEEFSVTCPPGWTVVAGGLESNPANTKVASSTRGTARSWDFLLQYAGGSTEVATVWVACVRPIRAAPANRKRLVRRSRVTIGPGENRTTRVRCPRRTTPAGIGQSFVQSVRSPRSSAVADPPRIAGIRPASGGYQVTLQGGAAAGEARLEVVCYPDTVTPRGGGSQRPVRVERERVSGMAPPGASVVTAACPRGSTPLGVPGYALGAGTDVLAAPAVAPEGGVQLRVSNAGEQPVRVTLFLSCVRGRLVKVRRTGLQVDTEVGPITIMPGR